MVLFVALAFGLMVAVILFLGGACIFVHGFAVKLRRFMFKPVAFLSIIACAIMAMATVTQVNLTTQVSGLLPAGNGGLNANAAGFTGILRDASGTATASELSGDCTTSGSNAITCQKVNGTTHPVNSAADQVIVTTASATGAWTSISNCGSSTQALAYSTSTHTFSCQTISVSGATFNQAAPSGTINGSNVTFTLSPTPSASADVNCFMNGMQQQQGAGNDYTISGATITYLTAPPTGTKLNCLWY